MKSLKHYPLLRAFLLAFVNLIKKEQIEIAGYVAYMGLLALFPFLLLLLSAATLFGQSKIGEETLVHFYLLLPDEVVQTVSPVIQGFIDRHENHILTLMILGIVWVSSSGIEALRTGLNRAYNVQEPKSLLFRRLQSLILLFVLMGAVFVSTFLMVIGPILFTFVLKYWPWVKTQEILIQSLRYGVTALLLLSAFTFAYWVLPCVKQRLKDCLIGALVGTLLWILSANLFSFYLLHVAQYNAIYGSVAGVVVTLIFFHLTVIIILYGAELNSCLRQQAGKAL